MFDYNFCVNNRISINGYYLKEMLENIGQFNNQEDFNIHTISMYLGERFEIINYQLAMRDINYFLKGSKHINTWNKDCFINTLPMFEQCKLIYEENNPKISYDDDTDSFHPSF